MGLQQSLEELWHSMEAEHAATRAAVDSLRPRGEIAEALNAQTRRIIGFGFILVLITAAIQHFTH